MQGEAPVLPELDSSGLERPQKSQAVELELLGGLRPHHKHQLIADRLPQPGCG